MAEIVKEILTNEDNGLSDPVATMLAHLVRSSEEREDGGGEHNGN